MTLPAEAPMTSCFASLRFKGDLDVVAAPWAKAEVRRLLQTSTRHLVLDFQNVAFVDSAGISLLVFVYGAYRARKGRAVLARVSSRVRRLLAIAGILSRFELYNSM